MDLLSKNKMHSLARAEICPVSFSPVSVLSLRIPRHLAVSPLPRPPTPILEDVPLLWMPRLGFLRLGRLVGLKWHLGACILRIRQLPHRIVWGRINYSARQQLLVSKNADIMFRVAN